MKLIVTMLLSLSWCVGMISGAQAAVIVTAVESGGNVIFSGSGTLNISSLSSPDDAISLGFIEPDGSDFPSSRGHVALGPPDLVVVDAHGTGQLIGPSMNFGTGGFMQADSGTGDRFGINQVFSAPDSLVVPNGYVSEASLMGTLIFLMTDFATSGLTPGSYVWSWGAGANADSLTLNITTVPTPSALQLFGTGLAALIGWNYRKAK